MAKWILRAEFDSEEEADAFINFIKKEKCYHIVSYWFDGDQFVYKILVELFEREE